MAGNAVRRLVPWLLVSAFALLAAAMVIIHVSDSTGKTALKQVEHGQTSLKQDIRTLGKLLSHPKQFAAAMTSHTKGVRKSVHTPALHEEGEEQDAEQDQEEEEEKEHREYYQSTFPTFGRKGVGPGFSAGDPVLNKKNKMIFERPCELEDECDNDDKRYYDWRNLKTAPRTANEDMYNQMRYLFKVSGYQMKQCKIGFHDDEVKAEVCEEKVARAMCGKFENINHVCDWTEEARHNRPDGTYYFDEYYKLSACHDNEARDAMQELCQKAEKLPGVNLSHWPWQGFSLNLNKRGFSGDWLMGPYGWSGRSESKF